MSYDAWYCTVTRVNYFSNPDVTYLDKPTGTETANCARAIEDNKVVKTQCRSGWESFCVLFSTSSFDSGIVFLWAIGLVKMCCVHAPPKEAQLLKLRTNGLVDPYRDS